jgi:hypothetical protein
MSRLIHIPETVGEIEEEIVYRKGILAWWTDKYNRGRKPARISEYYGQVKVTSEQIEILENALEELNNGI